MKAIADTGFVVAFLNRNDEHHAWALSVAAQIEVPLLTCEAVLAEASFHVQNVGVVLALVDADFLQLAFDAKEHLLSLRALAKRYADRKPDFADLCLVRMSELFPKHRILTLDAADFRVYRRNKREAIPCLFPPS